MTRLRAAGAAAVLVALAFGLIAAGDSRAWSGSDAGGRAATAVHMEASGTWVPEVGYWAERWDPDGHLHPLVNTERRGDHWVQATSVPFALASRPMLRWFGLPGLLLLPVAGCVLAAFSAGRLARWAGAASGWPAFWVVGVGTPALFYAADAWEHAPALGLGLAGLTLAVSGAGHPTALAAGLAGGAAIVLRAEMAVYLAAAALVAVLLVDQRRRWLAEWRRALVVVAGAAVPVAANALAERSLLGGSLRSQRASDLAQGAGASVGGRASDAVLTTVGIVAESSAAAFTVGCLASAALLVAGWWAVRGRPRRGLLAGGVVAVGVLLAVAVRFDDGLGFIPGWLPAAPFAAAGLAAIAGGGRGGQGAGPRPVAPSGNAVFLAALAVLALPGVWLTAHVGLLEAQWGGRYVLLTGVLLSVVGVVALVRVAAVSWAAWLLVLVTAGVTATGAAWHVHRTREIARVGEWVMRTAPADSVIVSRWPDLGRETGGWYGERRWLTARTGAEATRALEVAGRSGAAQVVLVLPPGATGGDLSGWLTVGRATHEVFGARLTAVRLEQIR